jgi:hypothetical protein
MNIVINLSTASDTAHQGKYLPFVLETTLILLQAFGWRTEGKNRPKYLDECR